MKKFARIICLTLVLLMCFSSLLACNNSQDNNNNNDDDNDIPTTKKDFGNVDYTILSRDTSEYEFDNSGEGTDDKVLRKVWERNVFIKDEYNVNVKTVGEPGDWSVRDAFIAKVRSSVFSGADEFSLVSTHSSYMQAMAAEGFAHNLAEIPEIDLDAAWWSGSYYQNSKINDAAYVLVGDISLSLYETIEVVFFNVSLAEAYQMGDLYKLVEDGKWTLDEMIRLTKVAGGFSNVENKEYGLLTNSHATRTFAASLGLKYTNKDGSTGLQKFRTSVPAKMDTAFKQIVDFYTKESVLYGNDGTSSAEGELNPIFSNGDAVFYLQMLGEAEYFAAAMVDYKYSVLPFPKLEEGTDSGYKSSCADRFSAQLIPVSVVDKEMVGTVTEALCKYGKEIITPEYYEQRLKFRYFDDHQVQSMLDIIREGLTFDFSMIYTFAFENAAGGSPYSSFSAIAKKNVGSPGSDTLAFCWQNNQRQWNTALTNLYKSFNKLQEKGE